MSNNRFKFQVNDPAQYLREVGFLEETATEVMRKRLSGCVDQVKAVHGVEVNNWLDPFDALEELKEKAAAYAKAAQYLEELFGREPELSLTVPLERRESA